MIHRETIADQLVKVIQVLQLARKTGTLAVERGEDAMFEEGTLVFINGQVTEAKTGQRSGLDAFNYLNTWGQCKFAFIPQTAEHFTQLPLRFLSDTEPSLSAHEQFLTRSTRPLPVSQPLSQPLPQQRVLPSEPPLVSIIPTHIRPVDESLRLIAFAGLSRVHKHVFLLVDGHRTIAELAHLTRHEPDELSTLLDNLEHIGVIQR